MKTSTLTETDMPISHGFLGRMLRMRETGLIGIILVMFVVMSFASPYFLTWINMRAMVMAFAVEGIVVIGMTILLISGGIDLSVGSVTALAMVVAGWLFLAGVDPWVASAIAIAVCTGIGAIMGFFVTRVGLHHFIVSLAVMVIARGVCLLGTGGVRLACSPCRQNSNSSGRGLLDRYP
ncbi:ABC transporter permease [Falsihalocynthiibacter arcticus]|uniref:ABC transporter permease n=1 Tax=Falsihalocynthiibacter arcticus TaxID=1579316 RepID=UPI00202A9BCA|nr:ABC transporter permease [Falsihalocynthiibacter arcticus]